MIDENNFIITDFFQYLILFLFIVFLYFRRNTLFIEEKFLENRGDVSKLQSNSGKCRTISRSPITNVPCYHSRDSNRRTAEI